MTLLNTIVCDTLVCHGWIHIKRKILYPVLKLYETLLFSARVSLYYSLIKIYLNKPIIDTTIEILYLRQTRASSTKDLTN